MPHIAYIGKNDANNKIDIKVTHTSGQPSFLDDILHDLIRSASNTSPMTTVQVGTHQTNGSFQPSHIYSLESPADTVTSITDGVTTYHFLRDTGSNLVVIMDNEIGPRTDLQNLKIDSALVAV